MEKLILIGAGGHAVSCIEAIERQGLFAIAGLIGTADETGKKVLGYDIIGVDADLDELAGQIPNALVALGQVKSAAARVAAFKQALRTGYKLPVIVSPFAAVSPHAQIGAGTVIMHGAVVNAGASIGKNCIINSRALVEHGTQVDDHCHISTGAILNGDVVVGRESFVGSGSVVKQGIEVGRNCVIGMGASVQKNVGNAQTLTNGGTR